MSVFFNNNFGFDDSTVEGSTETVYNDGEVHRVLLTFQNSQVDLSVDGTQELLLSGKQENCLYMCFIGHDMTICFYITLDIRIQGSFEHPPVLWVGGIPPNLVRPSGVAERVFDSFVGCMFNPAHSSSQDIPLRVFDPVTSAANM